MTDILSSMNRRQFLGVGAGALALASCPRVASAANGKDDEFPTVEVKGDFGGAKMYCFGTRCDAIGLSTVFVSKTGHVAVVDGGRAAGVLPLQLSVCHERRPELRQHRQHEMYGFQ
mgnify:CR=1 FL=1